LSRTLSSHGWCSLSPFRADASGEWLGGVLELPGGRAVTYELRSSGRRVVARIDGGQASLERADAESARRALRRVLNFDLDLSDFRRAAKSCDSLAWIADSGMGRLLRCPTAWEDLAKLVLTTNCSWALTKRMVAGLVERYGACAPDGSRAFPGPEALAAVSERELRERVRLGYRAPFVAQLARHVAAGRVDPESWEEEPKERDELRREMLELPGVGPYVADSMLKMVGRPKGLALDSWLRAEYARVYHGGRPVKDRTIARRYAGMGDWAGLALWCDMTRDREEDANESD
jgi:N-glycosylase/DNA lyase